MNGVEAGAGLDDMALLARTIGRARVVGMGEATHGTREFFQMKHRMFEYLVSELGFSVFAIEANWPECLAVNEYVMTGAGDPTALLEGLHFWTWNTEEVLALIEWMRTWNADLRHQRKVKFLYSAPPTGGFDVRDVAMADNLRTRHGHGIVDTGFVDREGRREAHDAGAGDREQTRRVPGADQRRDSVLKRAAGRARGRGPRADRHVASQRVG